MVNPFVNGLRLVKDTSSTQLVYIVLNLYIWYIGTIVIAYIQSRRWMCNVIRWSERKEHIIWGFVTNASNGGTQSVFDV